jgi:hypothetical protein
VQSKKPGEKVNLTIRRPRRDAEGAIVRDPDNNTNAIYDTMVIELELGSADLLLRNDPRGVTMPSRVQEQRAYEAAAVTQTRGPATRPIEVRGGPESLRANWKGEENDPEPELDRYPDVRSLLNQRRLIAQGQMVESPGLREAWNTRLGELLLESQNPDLNQQQRAYLRRVAERYAELMEPK